ncbi:COG1361 S-layer family protein [Haloplanus salinarum]|uniref:COG1361 S-layer family protein n=1 Tax=Haloplanus salinarum TaxID=1912324 RepID=UPI00214C7EB0|nr:COG1361 S-layer family protein [Haloplanus salinarum]
MHAPHRNVLLAALVVVAAVAATGVVAGQSSSGTVIGRPTIDVYSSTAEVEPGTQTELDLVLSNDGRLSRGGPAEYEERVTTARGVAVDVESGDTPFEINTGRVAVGEVPRGTTTAGPISITVPEDADPGRYRIPVTVSYAYTVSVEYSSVGSPEYNDLTREETQYVTLRVRDQAQFEVVDTETTTQVGDTGTLAVELRNHGTRTARDASVVLSSSTDELTFSGSTSSTGYVGEWDPGTNETVEYTVDVGDDAALRNYSLSATVEYEDTDGIARSSNPVAVGLRPDREQSFALRETNASLRVGEDGQFAGTVVNRGPDTARQPVVVLSSSNPNVVIESNEYALETLEPDETGTFDFDVSVSDGASASTQQFNVSVRYRNQRGDVRRSDTLENRLRIEPQRDRFRVEATNRTVVAGGTTTLDIRVTNHGDEPLRDIEAKAFVQSPLASDDDEGIVSALDPGETATITIGLSTSGNALEKQYPVSLDFQYELPDGDTEVSRTYQVPVTVERRQSGGLPFLPITVSALAVVGVGLFVYRRRRTDAESEDGSA